MDGLLLDTLESGTVTEEQAFAIPVPPATHSYQPVANSNFVHLLDKVAGMNGLTLGERHYGVDRKGQRLFGTCSLEGQNFRGDTVAFMMGFRNSYDKSLAAAVCFGAKVFVCSNLVFTGYADAESGIVGNVRHRHRPSITSGLFDRVKSAFGCFEAYKDYQENLYDRLEDTRLTQDQSYATIIRAAKAEAIPQTHIIRVANEYDNQLNQCPQSTDIEATAQWHAFRHRNAFSLFNAFTEVHKDSQEKSPVVSNGRSISLSNFFHNEFMN